jgi:hypothetical protein
MSLSIPSTLVRRFNYPVTCPVPYTRAQWDSAMILAQANRWTAYAPSLVDDFLHIGILQFDTAVLQFASFVYLSMFLSLGTIVKYVLLLPPT